MTQAATQAPTSAQGAAHLQGSGHNAQVQQLIADGEAPDVTGEAILRRSRDETVLWRGKPKALPLAGTAFHTNSIAVYFAILAVIAFFGKDLGSAITVMVMGAIAVMILLAMGYACARKSAYVLTNQRVIILGGIAIEKRISIPLKKIGAAHLRMRGESWGDIALEVTGRRKLGYLLLWPHARPLHFLKPQPLLRALEDAQHVAGLLAEACSEVEIIDRNLIDINEAERARSNAPSKPKTAIGGIAANPAAKGAPA